MTAPLTLRPPPWELPVWGVVLIWAFLPGSMTPIPDIGTIPVNAKHLALVGLLAYLVAVRLSVSRPSARRGPLVYVPLAFMVLTAYALLSLLWAGLPARDAGSMAVTALLGLSAMVAAYAAVSLHSEETLPGFLWRLALVLAVAGAVYSAESYFGLGLRGDDPFDFGIDRVRGPLFSAATGHFVMLPALGMTVAVFVRSRFRNPLAAGAAVVLAIAIFGLGSRAAIGALVVFVALAIITAAGFRRRVAMAAGLAALLAFAGVFLFARAEPERLLSLQDEVRENTHRTGLAIVEDRPLSGKVFGGGLGSAWSWYLVDLQEGGASYTGANYVETSNGFTLFHSHSLPLWAGVELGAPGLVLVLVIVGLVLIHTIGRRAEGADAILGAALAASLTAFVFDHYLVRLYMISTLWWMFVFAFLRLRTPALSAGPQETPTANTLSGRTQR